VSRAVFRVVVETAGDEGPGARAVDLIRSEAGLAGEQQEQQECAGGRIVRARRQGHGHSDPMGDPRDGRSRTSCSEPISRAFPATGVT
jgi:hypothetical protein